MLRVVFTCHLGTRTGGAERILLSYLRHADRRRVDASVVFFEDGPFVDEVRSLGVICHVAETGRFRHVRRGARAVGRTATLLRGLRPHLVVHWMNRSQVYGAPAAALSGLARRSVWWQWDLSSGRRRLDLAATVLPAAAILSCSASAAARQARIFPRRRVVLEYPGIEEPAAISAEERAALRARLGLEPGRRVVGIAARMQEWKNQDRLLDALAILGARGHAVQGLVVGGATQGIGEAYERSLRRQARDLGLDVAFTGHVPDALPYVQAMDILVSASDHEPFGLNVVEAMALEVPLVAVARGGPLEITCGGRCGGTLARSSRPEDLAAAIGRLLDDRALASDLARAGRRRYEQRFTIERMVEDVTLRLHELARWPSVGAP